MLKYFKMNLADVKNLLESNLNDCLITSDYSTCNIDELKQRTKQWKSEGYTIVFTAGVFDLLTINHLVALYHYKVVGGEKAKLIISIDTDERVRQSKAFVETKGNAVKPILSWKSRATMVAKQSLNHKQPLVDLILQHGDDTCEGSRCPHDDNVSIAESINPDIVIVTSKSTSTIEKLRNSPIIDSKKIEIINEEQLSYNDELLGKNISTSAIIERIRHEG